MNLLAARHQSWGYKPASAVLIERNEFGGSGPLLSLSTEFGIRERLEGEGRAASEDLSGYRRVIPGDLVVNRLVARDGAFAVSGLAGLISPAYWVLRTRQDFEIRFVNYLLRSTPYLVEIAARSKAMPPAQFDLPWEQFRTLPIASPQLSLQRSIADYLDRETARIDALITKKQRMIELFKERRTTVISSAVSGNAHFDSSTRGVGPWPRVKLRHVARFAYGDSLAAEERLAGPVRVFGSNGQVDVHDWPNTLGPVLVVGRKGSYGKIHHSTDPVFAIDTTYFVDASTTQHNLRWLYYVLSTLGLDLLSQDVGVPGLSRESAYEQRLSLPSPAEQGTIADYLDRETARIDIITGTLERQIDLLRERRQALITAAVTGELDVAGVAA